MKWIFFMLLFIPVAFALEDKICEDTLEVGKNCTMLTPNLYCAVYNYSIFNDTGSRVNNGTLTQLNGSIYYFVFNETSGSYIIHLCDASTREIIVEESEDTMIAIVAGLGLVALIFIVVGYWLLRNGRERT